ncbi:ATP-binding protein [Acrocarpospora catenulata]|uniref:ATP-binding protein n=1 Tax=Acrocarpospora catenulata TaxID=2836182 RepID=UPI001BDA37FD|nr:tetratricopeptide repeat protein [Acrocarpospora catenulata]
MIAPLVITHRRRLGLTQEELADRSGLSVRAIRDIESGRVGSPRPTTLRLLADAFGLADDDRDLFVGSARVPAPAPSREPAGERPWTRVAQLPPPGGVFVGRAEQLARLDALRPAGRRLPAPVTATVVGTAGVGKTALAVHWAHRSAAHFPDGQLYANLRGHSAESSVTPEYALAGFLRSLEVPAEQIPRDLDALAAMYRSLTSGRRILVLLDDAGAPGQVRPLLPASGMALITSRDELRGLVALNGAHPVVLAPLPAAESLVLLGRILGPDRVEADPDAAGELAGLCAHLPLALRIAAADLTTHPELTVRTAVSRLAADRLDHLEITGDPSAAVRVSFDLSLDAQPPPVQRVFRLMGTAPGGDISIPALAALAGISTGEAAEATTLLAGAHLVDRSPTGRSAMHDLLRAYAVERAAREDGAAETRAALTRLYDHLLGRAEAAADLLYPEVLRLPRFADTFEYTFEDTKAAADWLEAERENLVAAVLRAAADGPPHVAWTLTAALRGYFSMRMLAVDWSACAEAALTAAYAAGECRPAAVLELGLAWLHVRHSREKEAIDHYTKALELAEEAGWVDCQAATLGALASVHFYSGRLAQAADVYARSLRANEEAGNVGGQAVQSSNLGQVCYELGRTAEAAHHLARALELYRRIGSRAGESHTLSDLGAVYRVAGDFRLAESHLDQACALQREVGDRLGEAESLHRLAAVHCDTGRLPRAHELAQEAIAVAQEIGHLRLQVRARAVLGTVQFHLGDHRQAFDTDRETLRIARDAGERISEITALIGLARARHRLGGADDQALDYATAALALARGTGHRILAAQAMTTASEIHLTRGETAPALSRASDAIALHEETGHRPGAARSLIALGNALRRENGTAKARPVWDAARAQLAELGMSDEEFRDLVDPSYWS